MEDEHPSVTSDDQKGAGTWWLIECGSQPVYWANDGDWCSNPNHAHKFATADEAHTKLNTFTSLDAMRVTEHMWA